MKKLIEELPCIDIRNIKSVFNRDKGKHRIELIISDKYVQVIDINSTVGNFGGFVYWFICPGCRKRIKKIYLSIEEKVFLCRNCYNLAYKTQNLREFRKTKYLRKIKPEDDLEKIIKRREKLMEKLLEMKRFLIFPPKIGPSRKLVFWTFPQILTPKKRQ